MPKLTHEDLGPAGVVASKDQVPFAKAGKAQSVDRRRIESLAIVAAIIATQPGYTEEPEDAIRRAAQYLKLAEEFLVVQEASV